MPDSRKIEKYRRTLEKLARDAGSRQVDPSPRIQELEGRAAKLGLEIQGEESKAAPDQLAEGDQPKPPVPPRR